MGKEGKVERDRFWGKDEVGRDGKARVEKGY